MGSESSNSNSMATGSESSGSMASSIPGGTGTETYEKGCSEFLHKYSDQMGFVEVSIYKRKVEGKGGELLDLIHECLVIKHKKYSCIIIEWTQKGLAAYEVSQSELYSTAGTFARTLSKSAQICDIVQKVQDIVSSKTYNIFSFN